MRTFFYTETIDLDDDMQTLLLRMRPMGYMFIRRADEITDTLLHALRLGLVNREPRSGHGRVDKHFTLTKKGEEIAKQL